MQERNILKLAMVVALSGTLLLLFINDKMSLDESNIEIIKMAEEGTSVNLKGRVVNIKETPGLYIFNVEDDTGEIRVVAFKQNKNEELHRGDIVNVEGKVKNYKGVNEVEAELIVLY